MNKKKWIILGVAVAAIVITVIIIICCKNARDERYQEALRDKIRYSQNTLDDIDYAQEQSEKTKELINDYYN